MKKRFKFLLKNRFVFLFFVILVFVIYKQLFSSYFEADEWYGFTLNLPLTSDPLGFFKILIEKTVDPAQHVVPIGSEIFFLDNLFFGTNFVPYAFISLFLHGLNSFLVFLLIRMLLPRKIIFALLGGLFFALAPTPLHAVTWAATYQTSVLPVTFFLLSIIFLKLAYLKENKKFVYFSLIILFISLLTKETPIILFIILPIMAFFEKRIFSPKFLLKVYAFSTIAYLIFRFILPNFYLIPGKLEDLLIKRYIPNSYSQQTKFVDTGTIVSRDLSIYKNLPAEIVFRTITFPIKMVGSIFAPRRTVTSIAEFLSPIVYPLPSTADRSASYSLGETAVLYPISLAILVFCISLIFKFIKHRRVQETQTLVTGLAIIILSSLPLVPIVFTFPRWGFDSYFDSRYYYQPNVGAAIVFPFLLFGIAEFISKRLRRSLNLLVVVLLIAWAINNTYVLILDFNQLVNRYGTDRREILKQFKEDLSILPKKSVFYTVTDGSSIFGSLLPFYTSVPQAITVAYYKNSPLPNSFFNKPLFGGQPQGYQYADGRGFGYYTDKKDLAEALASNSFSINDVYGFYYYASKTKLKDITPQLREEMRDYLNKTDISQWKSFQDPILKVKFLYPNSSNIKEVSDTNPSILKSLLISDPKFNATISFIAVSPSFDIHETNVLDQNAEFKDKDVSFDKYHFNKVTLVTGNNIRYFVKLNTGVLFELKTDSGSTESLSYIERILGSLENL